MDPTLCRGMLARTRNSPLGEEQEGGDRGDTHVGVAIAQDLVQDVAELPAEDGTAGQGQPDGIGPEGEGSLLVVGPQDDSFQGSQGQLDTHRGWAGLFRLKRGHWVPHEHRDHWHNAAPPNKSPR